MRFNNMNASNDKKRSYIPFYILAVIAAIAFGYALIMVFEISLVLAKLTMEYWMWVLGAIVGILIIKRLWRKK